MATPLLLLARRQLRAHAARALLTAGGVACGVALVVAIETVNASALGAFTDAIEDLAGAAALQVRGRVPVPEAVADALRDLPGITHAVPVLTATFFALDPPAAGEALAVFAADVTDGLAIDTLHLVTKGARVVKDPLAFLVDPSSAVVTEAFAARTGLRDGERLRVRTPAGPRTLVVRGILPPGGVGRAYGGNLLLMDVLGAQTVLGRRGEVDHVDLALAPGVGVDEAAARVRALLPAGLEVLEPAQRGEQIDRYLRSYRTLLSGVSGLALLAAVFVAGSAMATSVAARRSELGLLRCIGAERRAVHRLVLAEAALTGLAGTALGVPLGLALARLLLDVVGESASIVFSLAFFRAALAVSPAAILLGVAAGLAAAVGAALLPARAATAVSPLAATRAEPPDTRREARWPARGAVAAAAAITALAAWAQVVLDSAWAGNAAALALDVLLVCLFMRHGRGLARATLGRLRPLAGVGGRLAIDRLGALPAPLALAGGVLALGLGLMLMAGSLAESFERSVLDFIRHQVRADLVVAAPTTTGWVETPLAGTLADALGRVPGVAGVERLRLAEHDHHGTRISIDSLEASALGADRAGDFVFAAGEPVAALARVQRGEAALVSRNFARQQGVGAGDVLALDTPRGRLALPVAGVVVDYVSPRGSVIVARPLFVRWWDDDRANRFHLTLAPGADAGAVRRAVAEGPGAAAGGVVVRTQRELFAYHRDAVRRAFRFTTAIEVLPLVVATLGLAEALLAVALDRRRELALLRAVGMTRGQLGRSVVAESAGVAALGFAGGLAMGAALAVLWVRINFAQQIGWDLELHFALGTVPAAALLAAAVGVAAGALPAHRVARLPPVAALRGE